MLTMKEEVLVRVVMDPDGTPIVDEVIVRYRKKKIHEMIYDAFRVLAVIAEAVQESRNVDQIISGEVEV